MVENIDFEELCLHFSNRANPKQQLEASNQLYSMLWSKETDLQAELSILQFSKNSFLLQLLEYWEFWSIESRFIV